MSSTSHLYQQSQTINYPIYSDIKERKEARLHILEVGLSERLVF